MRETLNVIHNILAECRKPRDPYRCGFDAGLNGPNTENCNFTIFSTKERAKEWERGKRDGEAKRKGGRR
jgi:ribosome modulation factor